MSDKVTQSSQTAWFIKPIASFWCESAMGMEHVIAGVTAMLLLGYLVAVLIWPEKF